MWNVDRMKVWGCLALRFCNSFIYLFLIRSTFLCRQMWGCGRCKKNERVFWFSFPECLHVFHCRPSLHFFLRKIMALGVWRAVAQTIPSESQQHLKPKTAARTSRWHLVLVRARVRACDSDGSGWNGVQEVRTRGWGAVDRFFHLRLEAGSCPLGSARDKTQAAVLLRWPRG